MKIRFSCDKCGIELGFVYLNNNDSYLHKDDKFYCKDCEEEQD